MKKTLLALALPLAVSPLLQAQFIDTFDTINPAWVTDRYEPEQFITTFFGGDNRLQITIDSSDSAANRPSGYSGMFYNTQGRQRPGGDLAPVWTVSADLFVASAFNTTTGTLMRTDLWTRDSNPVENNSNYPIFGITNASPTDGFNASAGDRSVRFRAYDSSIGWVDLGMPGGFTFDAWHNLSISSTGSVFEFRLDGTLLHTDTTYSDPLYPNLQTVFLEAYNFGQAGSYSVLWDNLNAVPEPSTYAAILGLAALGFVGFRRFRRQR
jgi:hypothetical protein